MTADSRRPLRPAQQKLSPQAGGSAGGSARGSYVLRIFQTLEALAATPRTAAEIAALLGVNRSTALRLLSEMDTLGYLLRDPRTRRYAIAAPRFYSFIASHAGQLDWRSAVDPVLAELREMFGEASIMGVPANGAMVYLAFLPSTHVITVQERLGTARPMHCSALGKAYLSALDDRALDSALASLNYQGGTVHAAKGPIELRRRVEKARERGYAIDRNETIDAVTCVAIPARIGATLIGAIGLSGPSQRIGDPRIAEMGKQLLEIVPRLGGRPR